VEVEVESFAQLDRALASVADMILLDNMTLDQLRECARRRNAAKSKALLEASGGVTLENVRAIAETGVDSISVVALTHSAVAIDASATVKCRASASTSNDQCQRRWPSSW